MLGSLRIDKVHLGCVRILFGQPKMVGCPKRMITAAKTSLRRLLLRVQCHAIQVVDAPQEHAERYVGIIVHMESEAGCHQPNSAGVPHRIPLRWAELKNC
jgi:hypothetical protein